MTSESTTVSRRLHDRIRELRSAVEGSSIDLWTALGAFAEIDRHLRRDAARPPESSRSASHHAPVG